MSKIFTQARHWRISILSNEDIQNIQNLYRPKLCSSGNFDAVHRQRLLHFGDLTNYREINAPANGNPPNKPCKRLLSTANMHTVTDMKKRR